MSPRDGLYWWYSLIDLQSILRHPCTHIVAVVNGELLVAKIIVLISLLSRYDEVLHSVPCGKNTTLKTTLQKCGFRDVFFRKFVSYQMFLYCCSGDFCKGICQCCRVDGTAAGMMFESIWHSKAVRVELELAPRAD